jgi:hypothetical protein
MEELSRRPVKLMHQALIAADAEESAHWERMKMLARLG